MRSVRDVPALRAIAAWRRSLPVLLAVASLALPAAASAAQISVSGGGLFGDPSARFSITARGSTDNGGATGRFLFQFQGETTHGFGFFTVQGPITCLRIEGSTVILGGTITQASPESLDGTRLIGLSVVFYVQDAAAGGTDLVAAGVLFQGGSGCPTGTGSLQPLSEGQVTVRTR
jgi:hypothetical protein